jgi:RND family efflux transporter MFP subunit
LIALAMGWVTACGPKVSADEGPNSGAPVEVDPTAVKVRELPKVRTSLVQRRDVERILETTSAVESVSEINVVAESGGRLIEVLVQEGAKVSAGQALARLDDRDQRIAVADAKVSLTETGTALEGADLAEREAAARTRSAKLAFDQAVRDLDRNLELSKGNKINPLSVQAIEASRLARDNAEETLKQAELAELKAAVETRSLQSAKQRAELTLERVERDLERTTLTSPIDGVVAQRMIEPGRNLNMGELAFQISDLENLRVVFNRPQRELELFTGSDVLRLTATTEARPGATFHGEIERTSPVIDRTSGSFRVTAKLNPISEAQAGAKRVRLLPGMLLRLFVVTGEHKDTLVVPKRAVRREGSMVFVLAVRDNTIQRIPVTEGYATDEEVEVLTNDPERALKDGDQVVLVGSRELEDGDRVTNEGYDN